MSEPEDDVKPAPFADDKHWLFKDWNQSDDNVEFDAWSNGRIRISVENPWAGDSECGFGQTCSVILPPDVARALAEWLVARTRD